MSQYRYFFIKATAKSEHDLGRNEGYLAQDAKPLQSETERQVVYRIKMLELMQVLIIVNIKNTSLSFF